MIDVRFQDDTFFYLDDSDSEYEIEVIEYFEKTTAWFVFEQSDSDAEE